MNLINDMTPNSLAAAQRTSKKQKHISRDFMTEREYKRSAELLKNKALRVVHFADSPTKRHVTDAYKASVAIPSLTSNNHEVWMAPEPVKTKKIGSIVARQYADLLSATFVLHEKTAGLEKTAFELYKKIFTFMGNHPNYRLVRLWNYVPNILDDDGNLERYRHFNKGRFRAWKAHGPKDADGSPVYPAATGIGSHGGPLIVEVLATTSPVHHLQNPRQTPAHQYSKKYGPLPPVFARATVCDSPQKPTVYVSGTASIVGEDAMWVGDPRRQAQETLENIKVLISRKNTAQAGVRGFALSDLSAVRVYVKYPEHLNIIQKEVERFIDPEKTIYLHDDICRSEWLLEVEGIASK